VKIVVVYASAGNGHRRAAEAIQNCFKNNYPEVDVTLVDIVSYTNWLFARFYSRGYSLLVVHLKAIWAITYHLTNVRIFAGWFKFFSRLNCRPFIKLLITTQPDIVLVTHFFPADVVSYLKYKRRINSRLVTVITDFCVHKLWVTHNCDEYIVGSDYTRDCLVARGINRDSIRVLGIPVDSGFQHRYQDTKRAEGLSVLLVTGAFGFSLIEKVVDMLFSEVGLMVVCGNNQRLYNRLEGKQYKGVQVYGFTDQMPRLMSQADFIITKPGGLTVAESLIMELPMFFIGAIPGQEMENARILKRYGCGIIIKNLQSLKKIIIDLKAHQ
jgi:processive 1,2-diacylglycerol beta-glucosyltransferase